MTEEIIKSITEAESLAAEIRRQATERAAEIVAEAQNRAVGLGKSATEVCKAYRETQIKTARADAEQAYLSAMQKTQTQAQAYCAQALDSSDVCISNIVGRISRGNR